MTLPELPPTNPSVEEFRVWFRSFTEHCERNGNYQCADVLFETGQKSQHPSHTEAVVIAMLTGAKHTRIEDL